MVAKYVWSSSDIGKVRENRDNSEEKQKQR